MSMRDFIDGDCGQNPVLKVATHFTSDAGLGSSSRRHEQRSTAGNRQDVSFLPPTTFQMDSLLMEIQAMNGFTKGPVQAPAIAEIASHPAWAEEFLKSEPMAREVDTSQVWAADFGKDLQLDSIWQNEYSGGNGAHLSMSRDFSRLHGHPVDSNHLGNAMQFQSTNQPSAKELLDDSRWVSEFSSTENTSAPIEKTELMATAEEFLKSVADPSLKATDFMNYVEQLSTGEIGVDGQSANARSSQWASEYEQILNKTSSDFDWSEEFITGADGATGKDSTDEYKQGFWQKLNNEWEKLAKEDSGIHPWLQESASKLTEPYKFAEENVFTETEDPFEEGKKKLAAGEISAAVLLFEVAVQKHPDNPECWEMLGKTQSLNEQDPLSIAALNKCLELDPQNLSALMNLAASLTNESYHLQACNTLKKWLKFNAAYSDLVLQDVINSGPTTASILPRDELSDVQRMFIEAARRNPTSGVDATVQSGLGILFSIGSDYKKAADCFRAALSVDPTNVLLWNRLGASLANGGESSEAIGAYRRALEISAGFVRARYNLGIACVNLGAYREAVEHFLTSLNIQARGKALVNVETTNSNIISDSIWTSLRTTLHLLDLSHLSRLVDNRKLDELNQEFNYR